MPVVINNPTEQAPNNPVSANTTGNSDVAGVTGSAVTTFVVNHNPELGPLSGPSFPTNPNGVGVLGMGHTGVQGQSDTGAGVFGTSLSGEGVHGETNSTTNAAVAGIELNSSSNIAAVYGEQM